MILCCGEALVDMLPGTLDLGRPSFTPVAGGAPYNTAVALARLEVPVALFTGLSQDAFGDVLRCHAKGVDLSLAQTSARPTSLAFVHLENGAARYSFYIEGTADRMITPEDLPNVAPEACLFGGISLAMEPCGSAYEALQTRLSPTSSVMLDINIRPALIQDETTYRARLSRMIAQADIVKISDEDLAWLMPDVTPEAGAEALCAQGVTVVILTLGERGARAFTASGLRVSVAALRVTVVDTVGAGDTFNAGFLAALHAEQRLQKHALSGLCVETLHAAMVQGNKAAGFCVSQAGASGPTKADLCAL